MKSLISATIQVNRGPQYDLLTMPQLVRINHRALCAHKPASLDMLLPFANCVTRSYFRNGTHVLCTGHYMYRTYRGSSGDVKHIDESTSMRARSKRAADVPLKRDKNDAAYGRINQTCGVTGGSTEAGAASMVTISNYMLARSAMM